MFSSNQIELSYLIAKEDFIKIKIAKAKQNKQSIKELNKKLQYNQALIKQLQNRINATIN